MNKRMFLKLEGVRGESENPRHYGSIEIKGFSWGSKQQPLIGGGPGKASISDLTVYKTPDKTSPLLKVASNSGQNFAQAFLTVEEIAEWGSMVRTLVFELKSVLIDFVQSISHEEETVTLNFESFKMKSSR